MAAKRGWQPVGDSWYHYYFMAYENSDLADNEGSSRKHLLFELLEMLEVISYVEDYPGCWEIILKTRK